MKKEKILKVVEFPLKKDGSIDWKNKFKEANKMKKAPFIFKIITSLFYGFVLVYASNLNKALVLSVVIYWIVDIYLREE